MNSIGREREWIARLRSRVGRLPRLFLPRPDHPYHDRLRIAFWAALGVKVALLVALLQINPDALVSHDTPSYVEPARSLLRDLSFSVDGRPAILRTPGYPLFLTPFLAVFGGSWVPAVVIAHFLLVAATALVVHRLVRLVVASRHRGRIAALAYVLVLFEPNVFLQQYNVATEVLFTYLLTLGVYLAARFLAEEGPAWALLAAVSFSAAAYVRPLGLYLPYLLGAVGLVYYSTTRRWRLSGAVLAAMVLHLGVTGAWTMRNQAKFGVASFTTISQHNLWQYVGASVASRAHGTDWGETRERFQRELREWEGNEAEKASAAADSALDILREHPVDAASIWFQGLVTNLADPGTGTVANTLGWRESDSGIIYKYVSMSPSEFAVYLLKNEKALVLTLGAGALWLVVMWVSAGIGWFAFDIRPRATTVLLVGVVAYVLAVGAGPQSMARFRMPVTPLILVFSAAGLQRWGPLGRRRTNAEPT